MPVPIETIFEFSDELEYGKSEGKVLEEMKFDHVEPPTDENLPKRSNV